MKISKYTFCFEMENGEYYLYNTLSNVLLEACHTNTNKCWAEILKAYGDENWDFPDPRCAFAPEMKTDLRF